MNPPTPSQPYHSSSVAPPPVQQAGKPAVDDAQMLHRMAQGDETALGEFYDRWQPLVHAMVLRVLRQPDDVADVVEEAFWQAWKQANRYESSRGAVQTWLLTIARSRALDRVRSLKRLREEPLVKESGEMVLEQATETDPSIDAESAERRVIVLRALRELPAEQREALELGYFGGLSQSEIALRLNQPLGTIKTRMRLAMQKLRDRLQSLREEAR